jgi:hypothetical protein
MLSNGTVGAQLVQAHQAFVTAPAFKLAPRPALGGHINRHADPPSRGGWTIYAGLPASQQSCAKVAGVFLKVALVTISAASAMNTYSADKPAAAIITPTTPAVLPGKGPAQHPFLYAGEWDTRKPQEQSIFIVREGKIVWQYSMPIKTASGGNQEFDDATLLSSGNVIFSRMSGAGMVSPDKKLLWDYPAPPRTEIHSCQSIGRGRVLIMRNGNPAQAMIINTGTGIVEKEIPIPTTTTGTHGQFRHIRMTKAGTLLVPHLGEGKVVEYDLEGKVLWSVPAKSPWHAVRLKNGNTLIAGDWSRYAREVNPKGETVWEFTQADAPGYKLGNIQTAHRLANGNTVMCCWIAGDNDTSHWPGTVQVLEVTPDKTIGWALSSWKDPDLGPATHIQLLDEPDALEDAPH